MLNATETYKIEDKNQLKSISNSFKSITDGAMGNANYLL